LTGIVVGTAGTAVALTIAEDAVVVLIATITGESRGAAA
jgi:hypothetical protein